MRTFKINKTSKGIKIQIDSKVELRDKEQRKMDKFQTIKLRNGFNKIKMKKWKLLKNKLKRKNHPIIRERETGLYSQNQHLNQFRSKFDKFNKK